MPVTGIFVDGDKVEPAWARYDELATVPPAEAASVYIPCWCRTEAVATSFVWPGDAI